ncbi:MAG: polyprenyl synthetase family protein [Acidimicrobiales bacterium]|jgi:geranylgeranyl diphosphate synthase type I|nr:polyprenyl synthetase family protein [Acidimicrobiales bacterium]
MADPRLPEPAAPETTPAEIQVIAARVRDRLAAVLDDEQQRWQPLDPDLAQPLASITRFVMSGGKRLRPAFCYWGFVAAGGRPDDGVVVDVGAAFEFLHAFALMHDDVMDGSATRRGQATIHTEFAGLHREHGWRGEPRRFGEGIAILAGDLAEVYADRLLLEVPHEARSLWQELKIEINVGQYLDVLGTVRGGTDLETARRISRYKSGKYTIERPLHVGAALAGGYTRLRPALSAYGAPLGEAFQLRDDILGVFGDTTRTGKPVGDDLREGKPTPLLAIAAQRCSGSDAALLARVGAPDLGDEEVRELQALLVACGAHDEIEQSIEQLTDQAVRAIDTVELPGGAREALQRLARYVADRTW